MTTEAPKVLGAALGALIATPASTNRAVYLIEAYWLLVLLMHNDPRRPIFYTFAALLGCRDRRTVRLGRAPANINNTAGAAIRR
jgi:hypothetical protein